MDEPGKDSGYFVFICSTTPTTLIPVTSSEVSETDDDFTMNISIIYTFLHAPSSIIKDEGGSSMISDGEGNLSPLHYWIFEDASSLVHTIQSQCHLT